MRRYLAALPAIAVSATALFACTAPASAPDPARARQQVFDTERAFAKTMAARDHAAFVTFLSPETIFFSGARSLRGSQQVADQWKRFYEGPQAPFSWEPETVEVLDSGTLALSSGPVRDAAGNIISTFNSIWRQESPGNWRIVFDKGGPACDPAP